MSSRDSTRRRTLPFEEAISTTHHPPNTVRVHQLIILLLVEDHGSLDVAVGLSSRPRGGSANEPKER